VLGGKAINLEAVMPTAFLATFHPLDDNQYSQWRTQEFFSGGSTNSVQDGGQREWGSGGCSPLVRDSTQLANE
jgi:hypothetical protein